MRALFTIVSTLLSVSYPLWVWLMLTYQRGVTWFAVILLLIGGGRLLFAVLSISSTLSTPSSTVSRCFPKWWSMVLNGAMAGLGLWGLLASNGTAFQVYPLMVNGGLLAVFGSSLWTNKSMIERFAEVYEKNITPKKQAYMRKVTQCWCGFFVLNFAISAYTWTAMSLLAWTWYNGVISYLLIGLLLTSEYAYRRIIFLKKHE